MNKLPVRPSSNVAVVDMTVNLLAKKNPPMQRTANVPKQPHWAGGYENLGKQRDKQDPFRLNSPLAGVSQSPTVRNRKHGLSDTEVLGSTARRDQSHCLTGTRGQITATNNQQPTLP